MASRANVNVDPGLQTGRRAAPRLRLSLPGVFLSTQANHRCIITNLSRTGALMVLEDSLQIGKDGFLRCGPIDHFVTVTRKEKGLNAVEFEIPVSDVFVMQVRKFQESFDAREQDDLLATAREWAHGSPSDCW